MVWNIQYWNCECSFVVTQGKVSVQFNASENQS